MSDYRFHASALGVGGVVTHGRTRNIIPSLASVALSPTGGEGYSSCDGYDANGISFSRAESRVVGAELDDGSFITYSDVFITNFTAFDRLNIPRLRIAMMSAQMTSTRNPNAEETSFQVRLSYTGVSIDGREVVPQIDAELLDAPTFSDVAKVVESRLPEYVQRLGRTEEQIRAAVVPNPREPFDASLVKGFREGASAELTTVGCNVPVLNYGRAFFGELLYRPGHRRVNLLRLKLGGGLRALAFSTSGAVAESGGGDEGDITGGSVEGNGTPPTGG